jgi:hypothetical protein
MGVGLKVGPHCIETAARQEIRRIEYLMFGMNINNPDLPPLEERHALLTRFIEVTDFRALRAERPELDGRAEMKVIVREEAGTFVLAVVIPRD